MISVITIGTVVDILKPNNLATQATFPIEHFERQKIGGKMQNVAKRMKCAVSDKDMIMEMVKTVTYGTVLQINGELKEFKGEYFILIHSYSIQSQPEEGEKQV